MRVYLGDGRGVLLHVGMAHHLAGPKFCVLATACLFWWPKNGSSSDLGGGCITCSYVFLFSYSDLWGDDDDPI